MDGQTYAVAEYENQQNHVKQLKTSKPLSSRSLHQMGVGRFAAGSLFIKNSGDIRFYVV